MSHIKRYKGRPRLHLIDNANEDMTSLRVRGAVDLTDDRGRWDIIYSYQMAKTDNHEQFLTHLF